MIWTHNTTVQESTHKASYRAIATNQDAWSDSRIVHWYNQRGEDSEKRIKKLKLDFGAAEVALPTII